MFMFKNCRAPELREANCNADSAIWNNFWKNNHPVTLTSFCSLMIRYLQWPHQKIPLNDRLHAYARAPTKKQNVAKKRLRTQSSFSQSLMASIGEWQLATGWQYADFTFIDDGIEVREAYCRNSMLLQQFLPPYVRSQACSTSVRLLARESALHPVHCTAIEAVNFFIRNFTRCWPIFFPSKLSSEFVTN